MALTYRALFKNYNLIHNITKPVHWNVGKNYPVRVLSCGICYNNTYYHRPKIEIRQVNFISVRKCITKSSDSTGKPGQEPEEKKLGLIQRFKQMYKDYWYVLLPVHMCTSAVWFGSFYYAVRR